MQALSFDWMVSVMFFVVMVFWVWVRMLSWLELIVFWIMGGLMFDSRTLLLLVVVSIRLSICILDGVIMLLVRLSF